MLQGVHGTFFGASLGKGGSSTLKFGKPDSLGHLATSPQQLGPAPVDLCILPHALEVASVLRKETFHSDDKLNLNCKAATLESDAKAVWYNPSAVHIYTFNP